LIKRTRREKYFSLAANPKNLCAAIIGNKGGDSMLSNNLEGLIEGIYTAALDREQWPGILTEIGDVLAGASGVIGTYKATGSTVWERTTWSRCDFRPLKKQDRQGNQYPGDWPWPQLTRDEQIQAKAILAQGLHQEVCLTLAKNTSFRAILKFIRPATKGLFTHQELHLLRCLMPHLRRALEIDQQLEAAKAKLNSLEILLNSLRTATLLLDDSACLLYANAAAEKLLSRKDGLQVRAQRLVACQRECDMALREILTKATLPLASPPDENALHLALSIHRPSGLPPYAALAVPYPQLYPSFSWPGNEPTTMLFISDPETVFCPEGEILQMLYGLTRTEAHLATLLASGKKLQEVADTLHISLNTAKTHLKNIFSKTGTCRQAELMQLCLTVLSGITPPSFQQQEI
jgi:DNA-binding CsgD family transcriptional regulator/PAS domain-containing protein